MRFELWETESANLITEYEMEAAALEFVRAAIRTHGREYVTSWELAQAWADRDTETIGIGAELADRALGWMLVSNCQGV